tara:strand:+ start:1150 stop:1608 length:459 start_codon:yes stop_codon:yes gene_type:complete
MTVEWMNHTGLPVASMEKALKFYQELFGLSVEMDRILEGDILESMTGEPGIKVHIAYLGNGDGRHSVELVEWLNPKAKIEHRNNIGAPHLGVFVDNVDHLYRKAVDMGIKMSNAPAIIEDAVYPSAKKIWLTQDIDGNWLEIMERAPKDKDS